MWRSFNSSVVAERRFGPLLALRVDRRRLVDSARRRFRPLIDCRRSHIVHATATELSLTQLNLVVWAKTNGGMGSLYRSQHELPRAAGLGRSLSCRLELRWDLFELSRVELR